MTNKAHQAIQDFLGDIQLIISCVTNRVCFYYINDQNRVIIQWSLDENGDASHIRLTRKQGAPLFIDINQALEPPDKANGFHISTKQYLYSIFDAQIKELISFHFHPELTADPILYPHIHVYADDDPRFKQFNLHKRHIPSGRVALEDIIDWLISELGVQPIREDWQSILNQTSERFKVKKTW